MSKEDHIVVAPGVYDGLSGRIALAAGAEVLYMVCSSLSLPPSPNPSILTSSLNRQEQEQTCPAWAPQTSASQP
jgi:hypothetical protein